MKNFGFEVLTVGFLEYYLAIVSLVPNVGETRSFFPRICYSKPPLKKLNGEDEPELLGYL